MSSRVTALVGWMLLAMGSVAWAADGPDTISVLAGPELDNTSYGTDRAPTIHEDGLIEFAACNANRYKWFHVVVKGVRGKRVTLRWTYEHASSPLNAVRYERPRIFYGDLQGNDRIAYEVCEEATIEMQGKRRVHTYTHTFKQDTARVVYSPIFINRHASSLLAEIESSPYGTEQHHLGKSHLFGLDLVAAVITDPDVPDSEKRGVWWMAREDSYETGGSLALAGGVRFLLSEDPVAVALRRKMIFWVLPIVSQDGVKMGHTNYPITRERYIYLTTQWDKPDEFPELGMIRQAMQAWKQAGRDMSLFHRFHSASYWKSYVRRYVDDDVPGARNFYRSVLLGTYLPHYLHAMGKDAPGRASFHMHALWPDAWSSASHSDFVLFPEILGTDAPIPLNNDASYQDGELYMRALAEAFGIPHAKRAPPILVGGGVLKNHARRGDSVTYRVVYRDLLGEAPRQIQVVIDGQAHDMTRHVGNDFSKGVVYTCEQPLVQDVNGFHFVAANAVGTRRIPCKTEYPGPFILEGK